MFADGSHYACVLAILDGHERLRVALGEEEDQEARGYYATWSLRSLDRALEYLAQASLGGPIPATRPEHTAERLTQHVDELRRQALALTPVTNYRGMVFFLVTAPYTL